MSYTTGLETIAFLLRGPGGKIFTCYIEVLIPADRIPDRCTVCFADGFAIAIGEVYIFTPVIKPVHFASVVFKEIIYCIGYIILWFFGNDRFAGEAGTGKDGKEG
jgi:hypothetical protein